MATPNKTLRLLFIACAGISTFYVSAQLAGSRAGGDGSLAEPMTKPPKRDVASVGRRPAPAASNANAAAVASDGAPKLDDRARTIPRSGGDLFAQLSWLPPPPPAAPPPPPAPPPKPPEPKAPPLPFSFVGMLERGAAKPAAFLAKADALLVVSVGDMLDNNTYRVDSLTANEVVMTYLPLNIQQTLRVPGGAASDYTATHRPAHAGPLIRCDGAAGRLRRQSGAHRRHAPAGRGQRDAAIAKLREASRLEPTNPQYRIDLLNETQKLRARPGRAGRRGAAHRQCRRSRRAVHQGAEASTPPTIARGAAGGARARRAQQQVCSPNPNARCGRQPAAGAGACRRGAGRQPGQRGRAAPGRTDPREIRGGAPRPHRAGRGAVDHEQAGDAAVSRRQPAHGVRGAVAHDRAERDPRSRRARRPEDHDLRQGRCGRGHGGSDPAAEPAREALAERQHAVHLSRPRRPSSRNTRTCRCARSRSPTPTSSTCRRC